MSVISFLTKRSVGMIVIPLAIAGVVAVIVMKKNKGSKIDIGDGEAAADKTFQVMVENSSLNDRREDYLAMEPLKSESIVGMKELNLFPPSNRINRFEKPASKLSALELICSDGIRLYLFHKDDDDIRMMHLLTEDVTQDPNFKERCFFMPDDIYTVQRALAKLLPYLGWENIKIDDDCRYFIDPPHFRGGTDFWNKYFMASASAETLSEYEREFLMRTCNAWEGNNMLQLLGRDVYEYWSKRMDKGIWEGRDEGERDDEVETEATSKA